MTIKKQIWSLTLIPGETYPMLVRRDFQLTNAALGEELRSTDGRSVIKVTYVPNSRPIYDSDSDSDSEIDSDDSDYSFDPELEAEMADEFELDSDEEGEGEEGPKKAKANGVKVNGDAEAEDEDDEEDEEDEEGDEAEDEEDHDSDFSDEEEEEEVVICSLTAGKIEQASLDLTFPKGIPVMFEVTGENAVHLSGNYVNQFSNTPYSDSDFDSDEYDDYSELYGSDEDEELDIDDEDEEDEEAVNGKIELLEDAPKPKAAAAAKKPVKAESKPAPAPAAETKSAKRKVDEIESPAKAEEKPSTEGLSKKQKKALAKKARDDASGTEAKAAAPKAQQGQKKTLPSGLIIEDVKVGDGPVAKTGKRLGMRYIGKLENGKQFDANTSGKPFSFLLGRGEVISGWDQGLVGMAVGGERRLTIPPALAYGSQKLPGIPKNSTLKFEVKLVSVA